MSVGNMVSVISSKKFTFSQEYREGVNDALDEMLFFQKELLSDSHLEQAVNKVYDEMKDSVQILHENESASEGRNVKCDIFFETVYRVYVGSVKKMNSLKNIKQQLNEKLIDKKKRSNIDPSVRLKVFKRDCFKCVYCGESPASSPKVILEIDHIQPLAKGGANSLENYQTLCHYCHAGKGTKF